MPVTVSSLITATPEANGAQGTGLNGAAGTGLNGAAGTGLNGAAGNEPSGGAAAVAGGGPGENLAALTRPDFPLLAQQACLGQPLIYLDYAATSQKPRQGWRHCRAITPTTTPTCTAAPIS